MERSRREENGIRLGVPRGLTGLARAARILGSFFLPDSCIFCGAPLGSAERHLCADCRRRVCVKPLNLAAPPGAPFGVIHYALPYEGPARELICALKYGARTSLARELAGAGLTLAQELGAECVVPVPLHSTRNRERGFNQSALLAAQLGEALAVQIIRGLVRTRPTRTQTELSKSERRANVEGAFRGLHKLTGRKILLLDDVVTTGSTLAAAGAAASEAGAARIVALAIAGPAPRGDRGGESG